MPEIIEKTLMENTSGKSNKFYEVSIVSATNGILSVQARWGKRTNGSSWKTEGGQWMEKWNGTSSLMAKREKNNLVRAKRSKGYVEVEIPKSPGPKLKSKKKKSLEDVSLERFSMLDI